MVTALNEIELECIKVVQGLSADFKIRDRFCETCFIASCVKFCVHTLHSEISFITGAAILKLLLTLKNFVNLVQDKVLKTCDECSLKTQIFGLEFYVHKLVSTDYVSLRHPKSTVYHSILGMRQLTCH